MKKQATFLGIPYNWSKPTWKKIKEKTWNKNDHRLFTPRIFGWGYTINFYELVHHRKNVLIGLAILIILFSIFVVKQIQEVDTAHSTFKNYYAFRGCVQLLKKTDAYGLCKVANGQIIKIVKFNGKWYLDGDLPMCFSNICL
ncbi:MAG TPA: DUF5808 domain-containing protein [Candidatus Sulfotelmatobacter sp.]|jgi:hypothetical protein|nr:DUF5808 domain-containing protein [Candidatus Sulfotelmatobacter sp.]